jgi:phosphate starvation-inducible PhoH-like protein
VLTELIAVVRAGIEVSERDLESSVRILRAHPSAKLTEIFALLSVTATAGRQVSPRGLAQGHYVQAIQTHDIVFGVGPAGTGKTYLALGTCSIAFGTCARPRACRACAAAR